MNTSSATMHHRDRDPAHRTSTKAMTDVARWIEARIHETVGPDLDAARLYGLEVVDPALFAVAGSCAARVSFGAEHADPTTLVLGSAVRCVDAFDALVLVNSTTTTGSAHPVDEPQPVSGIRVATGDLLRRTRIVVVVSDTGTATAVRKADEPSSVLVSSGLAAGGGAGLRLAAVWAARLDIEVADRGATVDL